MTDAILTRREGSALIAQINNSARRNAIAKEPVSYTHLTLPTNREV